MTQTTHRPWSRQEAAKVITASKAERARSPASQEWVDARNGRVDARIGIAKQCTAQTAGRTPNQPKARPSAEAAGGSAASFQIGPASTFPACVKGLVD
jgi:hypothetical protein